MQTKFVRAGNTNMFQSEIFTTTFANLTGAEIELFNTDGAQGAARGAGYGVGEYSSLVETFNGLTKIKSIFPDSSKSDLYHDLYADWIKKMDCMMDYK